MLPGKVGEVVGQMRRCASAGERGPTDGELLGRFALAHGHHEPGQVADHVVQEGIGGDIEANPVTFTGDVDAFHVAHAHEPRPAHRQVRSGSGRLGRWYLVAILERDDVIATQYTDHAEADVATWSGGHCIRRIGAKQG